MGIVYIWELSRCETRGSKLNNLVKLRGMRVIKHISHLLIEAARADCIDNLILVWSVLPLSNYLNPFYWWKDAVWLHICIWQTVCQYYISFSFAVVDYDSEISFNNLSSLPHVTRLLFRGRPSNNYWWEWHSKG